MASLIARQLQNPSSPQYTYMHALYWCIEIATALEYLHSGAANGMPIIHRDVKLDNVLLSAPDAHGKRCAKLADFGLQKVTLDDPPRREAGACCRVALHACLRNVYVTLEWNGMEWNASWRTSRLPVLGGPG